MDVVTKEATATATITPVRGDESEYGEADVILSTSALDRDGDELHPDEWKQPLPDYITFDTDHGMSVATTVGGGQPFINDKGQLQVRVGFSSLGRAQDTRTLVNERIIRNVSVAFLEHKDQKTGKVERELLNGAFVAVPANPEAVILASKHVSPADLAAAAQAKKAKDDDQKKPYGDVTYADPKNNKYPIDTEAHVRAAWSYINMDRNASQYSSEELSAIKGRIKRAAEKFGIDISDSDKKASQDAQTKDAANYKLDENAAISDMFENDPLDGGQQPQRKAYWQGVHDLAVKLGAGCPYSDPQATPGVLNSSNRTVDGSHVEHKCPTGTIRDGLISDEATATLIKSLPTESTEESTASSTADEAADVAADESADEVALLAKRLAIRLASLVIDD